MSALIALWDANAATGLQRAGLLYGSYRPDPNFRHGVKAVVEAIYEPPQAMDATAGVVQLLPDPQSKAVAAGTRRLAIAVSLCVAAGGSLPAQSSHDVPY